MTTPTTTKRSRRRRITTEDVPVKPNTQVVNNYPLDFTVKETAKILRISMPTIRVLIKSGAIQSYKIGKRGTRISRQQLDDFRNQ